MPFRRKNSQEWILPISPGLEKALFPALTHSAGMSAASSLDTALKVLQEQRRPHSGKVSSRQYSWRVNFVLKARRELGAQPVSIGARLRGRSKGDRYRERERESPKRRFSQKTADFRRFTPSPGHSSIWRAQETAESCGFSQNPEDFRRKPHETTDRAPSP